MGEENGNQLQYSCQGNSMDRGAWRAMAHGVAESDMTEQRIQDGETGLGVDLETGLGMRRWTQGSRVEHGVDVGVAVG